MYWQQSHETDVYCQKKHIEQANANDKWLGQNTVATNTVILLNQSIKQTIGKRVNTIHNQL